MLKLKSRDGCQNKEERADNAQRIFSVAKKLFDGAMADVMGLR